MIVLDEHRCTVAGGRRDVLVGVCAVDPLELRSFGYALRPAFEDDRVSPVAVQQDDLRLVRDVPRLACDGRTSEVNGLSVPPEPDWRCIGRFLGEAVATQISRMLCSRRSTLLHGRWPRRASMFVAGRYTAWLIGSRANLVLNLVLT